MVAGERSGDLYALSWPANWRGNLPSLGFSAVATAIERNDMATFGILMGESHRSLRENFEVSSDELDLLVDLASRAPGVIGAHDRSRLRRVHH